jgi:hypothetical protein
MLVQIHMIRLWHLQDPMTEIAQACSKPGIGCPHRAPTTLCSFQGRQSLARRVQMALEPQL